MKNNDENRFWYAKFLVDTLGSPFGLVEPFTSPPPDTVKPLHTILPPVVYADLLNGSDKCLKNSRENTAGSGAKNEEDRTPQEDETFYQEQLYPPEGVICYAAAFSTM